VAFALQIELASLLMPGNTLDDLKRRGLLYGTLLQSSFVALRNENTMVAGERFGYGTDAQLVYQF